MYVRVIERLKKFEDEKYYYSPRYVGKDSFKVKIDKFPKSRVEDADEFGFQFKDGTKRLTFISHLRRVILDESGFKILELSQKPSFFGIAKNAELGVEDPRITPIGNKFYMTYVGLSRKNGISTHLAVSKDLEHWERLGIIFGEQDKDVVLFPEKVKGKYVAFDRPEGNFAFSPPHIWIAYSKDLLHWGELQSFSFSLRHTKLDRSGAGPPPIKTKEGWLFIFHAVSELAPEGILYNIKKALGMEVEQGSDVYAAWAAVLDLDNPQKILAHSHVPLVAPKKKYEISFEGKRVVFPTGLVLSKNEKDVLMYSGAGDTYVSVKRIALSDIFRCLIPKGKKKKK